MSVTIITRAPLKSAGGYCFGPERCGSVRGSVCLSVCVSIRQNGPM